MAQEPDLQDVFDEVTKVSDGSFLNSLGSNRVTKRFLGHTGHLEQKNNIQNCLPCIQALCDGGDIW